VSAAYFDVLGIRPAIGRGFAESDDLPGAPRVALLADGLWRRRFGADPAAIGRTLTLGDVPFTIVGVMPRTFENVLAPEAEIWTPLQYDPALPVDGREWGHHLRMAGRVRGGVSLPRAADELAAIAGTPLADLPRVPWASLANGFIVVPLREALTRDVKPVLLAFFAAVALVLTIASANVANLLLARALHRRREFAVRAALGAGRGRLLRQLLTEGLAVAALGGALGVAVAQVTVDALVALRPPGLPRLDTIALDGTALLFALFTTVVVAAAIALLPALQTFRGDLQRPLQQNARTAAGGGHRTARHALVVAEVALALVLLVSAGLLFRSLRELVAVAPGFDPSAVTAAQVQTVGERFRETAAADQFFARVLERVRTLPGVSGAAATNLLPLGGDLQRFGVFPEHAPTTDPGEDGSAYRYAVTPDYFTAMRIPLRRGRLLGEQDRAGAPGAVVISERLAARRFRGVDPLGRRLRIGPRDGPWFTVVGIVGDVKQSALNIDDAEAVYTTPAQWLFAESAMWIVVRSQAGEGLPAAIRGAVWSIDGNQPVVRLVTMPALTAATMADRRFALLVFGVFGGVALLLSVTGLYSALARSVTERTREIGVRAALGASSREILSMVLRQGLRLALAGTMVGVAGAIGVTRWLESLLFGTTPTDPLTYAGAALLFMTVAAIASTLPAVRAATIDPAITLRAE
jgi:putative ABC transport system permease protein